MFESSIRDLGVLLIVAILVIYIVLGILYESFIHPLTILSALPLAGVGALATLLIFGAELNIYSFVGLVLLVGLVKKNGIIMIDFALEAQRVERKTPEEAIFEACVVRFRPIMMTTMAALMGSASDRHRLGGRRRVAPAAGPGRGGGVALLPDADALRDAGFLSLHGLPAEKISLQI